MAAQRVAKDPNRASASISSKSCVDLYNMEVLAQDIQNFDSNHTRFICIAKNARIYPGANRTSIMMVMSHKPGTLFSVLSKFNATGPSMTRSSHHLYPNLTIAVSSSSISAHIRKLSNLAA